MKTQMKYALGGLGLAVCATIVIVNLDSWKSPFLKPLVTRMDVRNTGPSDRQTQSAEVAVPTRHGARLSQASPTSTRKNLREKPKAPKRNRVAQQDKDSLDENSWDKQRKGPAPVKTGRSAPKTRNQPGSISVKDTAIRNQAGHSVSALPKDKNGLLPKSGTQIKVGELPDWWRGPWKRSAVFANQDQFVGDKPLFPACKVITSDTAKLYDFVEPQQYLPSEVSKNPCWYLFPQDQKGLHCVPYVYLAGVAKCGTTDMSKRLKMHPEVFEGTSKEYHWWERHRFGTYDEDDPEKTVNVHGGMDFPEYLRQITGNELAALEKELRENGTSRRIFGDYSPSYLWDPQNWYAIEGNQGCQEPRVIVAHHIRRLYPPAKIILTFRHPTPRLYSRFLSRLHRSPTLNEDTTVQDFHRYVNHSVAVYRECFRRWSIRQCAYNFTVLKAAVVRLVEGMYPVFMADWLRVWPRDQMLLMRYEDYGGHERQRLQEIMDFLGLSHLNKQQMDVLLEKDVINSGSVEYDKYGRMLPKTKQLLDDFYQPFVDQFALLLNDSRFLWKDVYKK